MSLGQSVKLSSGLDIPTLGFGTWQSAPGEVSKAVYEALKAGYRHLDLALIYENQPEVAEGIAKGLKDFNLKREDLFITSKLWNSQHSPALVPKALDKALKELNLTYLDQFLIHWPVAFQEVNSGDEYFPADTSSTHKGGDVVINDSVTLAETWKAVLALPKDKVRTVGVSNFNIEQLESIIAATGQVPATNQIERHPLLPQPELIAYAKEKGIHITAYSAFGNNAFGLPLIINRPEVQAIAKKASARLGRDVTPAQVVLAWSKVGGHSVIPKSITPSRIASNFDEIELSEEEIKDVDALGKNPQRFNIPYTANSPRWDINIFNDPSEAPATHKPILK
ncbi:aldo/keto reductase family protein [Aaosphaeria arxii CBS 175.79]|uniref:Aldo/keto reductase family protein n=1 Tax=Aaosphaeria arxii CBS 175.79 TaxID=1450172 RepID=A0A6A5Y1T5_9PLEO|nr:aldo/keto reductase family protein [Aaosphaeria arxii CBS 175.79]KAF2019173.1 aldo/keto reductase family protein [Aaosphaeria arxii CBS 175.79]